MKRKRKLNMPKKKWKPDRYIHVNILKQLFPKAWVDKYWVFWGDGLNSPNMYSL